jgi:hypothetical protein
MATPLRAFLMTRNSTHEWRIAVFRDLEDLVRQWEQRDPSSILTAVVHVGFDRPPTSCLNEISTAFENRVLLTASAKYALPKTYKSSTDPVADVNDIPVFLAIQGWGYEADDIKATPTKTRLLAPNFEDWLQPLVTVNPKMCSELREAGIYNDQTYLSLEHTLNPQSRREIGIYRFKCLIKGDVENPCVYARCAPPWLLCRAMTTLALPVRAQRVFESINVITVSDLADQNFDQLLRTPNFGRKSLADVIHALNKALQIGPIEQWELLDSDDAAIITPQFGLTLFAAMRQTLESLKPRNRDILSRRIGLDVEAKTLADIGTRYDITRERVRQIETKTLKQIINEEAWPRFLKEKISAIVNNRDYPLPLAGISAINSWFDGCAENQIAFAYILENICHATAYILNIDGIAYLTSVNQEKWDAALADGKNVLRNNSGWSKSHCKNITTTLLPATSSEMRELFWDKVSENCHFATQNGEDILISYGFGADHFVKAILQNSDRALHYSEIAKIAEQRSEADREITRIHNAAHNVGILFGPGIYGLEKHIQLSRDKLIELAEEAENIVAQGPIGRQWHAAEMLAALIEQQVTNADKITKFELDYGLKQSGQLKWLRRMVWTQSIDEAARVDIRQATISILQQAGHPLSASQILKKLQESRGLSECRQILTNDPIIRVGPSEFGLNDRDVPIKRHDQPKLIDIIIRHLIIRGKGIHVSEMASLLPQLTNITAEAVFSLAILDARLKTSVGQYLYLAEWGEPRRESLKDAVENILRAAGDPISLHDLVALVSERIGRKIEKPVISSCLQAIDAVLDQSGSWSLYASHEALSEFDAV